MKRIFIGFMLMVIGLCTASAAKPDSLHISYPAIFINHTDAVDTAINFTGYADMLGDIKKDIKKKEKKTPKDSLNWWYLLRRNKLNIQDTAVHYPRFLKFCVDLYNWGDRAFNSYDTTYVVGTGRRWKVRLASDNWLDSYAMSFPEQHMSLRMASDVHANVGLNLQYMAVGIGYSINLNHALFGSPINHKRLEWGFNCARFNFDFSYTENTGGTYIRKFNLFEDGKYIKSYFPGAELHTLQVDAYYFLNNRKYSQGAAYNFSKIQKKSAGSFMVGFAYTNQNFTLDFSRLDEKLLPIFNLNTYFLKFHYNNYCLLGGYGFNWVWNRHMLFNITAMPTVGFLHSYEDATEGSGKMFSLGIRGRSSITYNLGDFFVCAIGRISGQWYRSDRFSLFSSIENGSLNIGYRF